MRRALRQEPRSVVGRDLVFGRSHHVDPAMQVDAIHFDPDQIAVAHLGQRPAGQRFRPDMPDARSGADAGEPRVGHDRHVAAPRRRTSAPK